MVATETLQFYCGKLAKLLTSNLACVSVSISCVWLEKFDKNLYISGVENEVLLKLVKCFEMRHLQSHKTNYFVLYVFRLPRE